MRIVFYFKLFISETFQQNLKILTHLTFLFYFSIQNNEEKLFLKDLTNSYK